MGACNTGPAFSNRVTTGMGKPGLCGSACTRFLRRDSSRQRLGADVRRSVVPRVSVKFLLNKDKTCFVGRGRGQDLRAPRFTTNTCPKLVVGTISLRLHYSRTQRRRVQSPARRENSNVGYA